LSVRGELPDHLGRRGSFVFGAADEIVLEFWVESDEFDSMVRRQGGAPALASSRYLVNVVAVFGFVGELLDEFDGNGPRLTSCGREVRFVIGQELSVRSPAEAWRG